MATRRSQRRTFLKTVSLGAAALSMAPAPGRGQPLVALARVPVQWPHRAGRCLVRGWPEGRR